MGEGIGLSKANGNENFKKRPGELVMPQTKGCS